MRSFVYTLIARLGAFLRRSNDDDEFDQELREHLAMAEQDNIRAGLSPDDARRQARLELGGVAQLRESARAARGLPWLETFLLDARLGLRMLRKSWGLTVVGGLAMAVTIGLGASVFTIWDTLAGTRLPLDDGDRVVAIQPFDRASQRIHRDSAVADFLRWRESLRSITEISAMRTRLVDVVTRDAGVDDMYAGEMTASAFRLARVAPFVGRPLVEDDERADAPPVAVLGHGLWRTGFSSDPAIVGQPIEIDGQPHVVVGVMPPGFRFPVNQRIWVPLRSHSKGPVFVFGRLAPDATVELAQNETVSMRLLPSIARSATRTDLEPRVVPYATGLMANPPASSWVSGLIFLLGALLLIPPCANIAILVYARTVTRRQEFAARTALGASRSRIVMQLFVEVLVLAAGAGAVGFVIAGQFSGRLARIVLPSMSSWNLPFWMDFTPALPTVFLVTGLSIVAAAIAGAVPAIQATGRWRAAGLTASASRHGGARLGKTWMTLLAAQVALALMVLPSAAEMTWGAYRPSFVAPALPVEEFVSASLEIHGGRKMTAAAANEAVQRLSSEPGVSAVTMSSERLMEEPQSAIEIEGQPGSNADVGSNLVDPSYLQVFSARLLAGRVFETGDYGPGETSVVVNRSFVDEVLSGEPALGRRFRSRDRSNAAGPEPVWYDIVGVVDDLIGTNDGPQVFRPLTAAPDSVVLNIRLSPGASVAPGRFEALVAGVDARLRLTDVESLAEVYAEKGSVYRTVGTMVGSIATIVLLFSMAGMYTLMTFIVAQRWREIGVRLALGARPGQLLLGIFGRAAVPLVVGAVFGGILATGLNSWLPITEAGGARIPGIVALSAALMLMVGLLAVVGPARRAIKVDPTEALRVG